MTQSVDQTSMAPGSASITTMSGSTVTGSSGVDRDHQATIQRLLDGESRLDRILVQCSDWCSPILVKETRQALKSRQFQWTFLLLMLAIAGWTFFAVLSSIPGIYFYPTGKYLLVGYLLILIVPTIIVVPNAAYRSMASELEQGTFDVLSLSPLSPFQIVIGKLAVATVQSGIYFSALTPCIALTYLLRGVSWSSLVINLACVFVASIFGIAVGMLLGALDRSNRYATLLSILMIVFSLGTASTLYSMTTAMIFGSDEMHEIAIPIFVVTLSIFMTYIWLIILAASAAIGMASENYSTTIRWWCFAQSVLLVGAFAILPGMGGRLNGMTTAILFQQSMRQVLCMLLICQGIHWGAIGVFFVSEQGVITPRSRRRLPSTLIQRLFLTWGNPGSSTGYVFTLASFFSVFASTIIFFGSIQAVPVIAGELLNLGLLIFCWLAFYLGLVRLFLLAVPRSVSNRLVLGPLLLIVFITGGALLTLVISSTDPRNYVPTYQWYSVANIFWTISMYDSVPSEALFVLLIASSFVMVLNWLTLFRDLVVVRLEAPPRVLEEQSKAITKGIEASIDPLA